MRQALYDYWTIDVDPTFSRRETDDGFIVLERPGIQIWVVIYADQPFDADESIQWYMGRYFPKNSELFEREQSDELVGSAFLVHKNGPLKPSLLHTAGLSISTFVLKNDASLTRPLKFGIA